LVRWDNKIIGKGSLVKDERATSLVYTILTLVARAQ